MKGATIRKVLARVRITQTELAQLLGITPQAVSAILMASDIRTSTVERICKVLNLPVSFFYDETDQSDDNSKMQEAEKSREIEYLRGQVAAYETALNLLRPSNETAIKTSV